MCHSNAFFNTFSFIRKNTSHHMNVQFWQRWSWLLFFSVWLNILNSVSVVSYIFLGISFLWIQNKIYSFEYWIHKLVMHVKRVSYFWSTLNFLIYWTASTLKSTQIGVQQIKKKYFHHSYFINIHVYLNPFHHSINFFCFIVKYEHFFHVFW